MLGPKRIPHYIQKFTLDHINLLKVYFPHSMRYLFIRLCITTKMKLPAVLLSGTRYFGEGEETSNPSSTEK
jgi:hypothetical protein